MSKYLDQSAPARRTYRRRGRPVWARVQPRLEELVAEWEPRRTAKQRLTGVRLHRALLEEGYQVGLTTIHQYLRERRRQRAEAYVPLIHRVRDEAQVDRVIVNLDSMRSAQLVNQRSFYVTISRAREDAQIYTDDARALRNAVKRGQRKEVALEVIQPPQQRQSTGLSIHR